MAENFLKYTGLNYSEIYAQIRDKINADSRFDNFRESAIAQTLIEIFAGTTDIANYYIQRRAEECYFDTAQLKSSVISLSRQLGYVVTRPTPAQMNLKIVLEGDFSTSFDTTPGADNKIQIPYYSKFTMEGNDFVLVDTFTYNVSNDVVSQMVSATDSFKLELTTDSFNNNILVAQGEIKEKVIIGSNNTQVGSNFQLYKIEDKEFSDIFGDKDYFHNPVTKVYVGNDKTEDTLYSIDRRSLINWESLLSNDLSDATKLCVIRTTPDEFVEVLFGDGGFAAKGALTREDNIYIQYLATKGKSANKIGVLDNDVNYSGQVYTNRGVDITDKVTFKALTNITGGADLEDIDSIKYSSPKIYYSLDRLVNKDDYVNYLKTLKSPIVVKNALAWGEQEERDKSGVFADIKMFNVGFFSCVGSLYNVDGDTYSVKTTTNGLDDAVLDLDYDPDEIQVQSYFNVYTRQTQANQLKYYDVIKYYSKFLGSKIDSTLTPAYFEATYQDNAVLNFKYGSEITSNASNITTDGSVTVDLNGVSTMADIALKLTEALAGFNDERANAFDNQNYNQPAFTSADGIQLVVWNATENRFEVSFGSDSPTLISEFSGAFSDEIGLTGRSLFSIAITQKEEISGRITTVVDDLNSRGQMNINNIYISPIIHNFLIKGTVYVKPLFDKEELKRTINNSIYEWLNLNADFNEPIRLSNIVEIIEKNSGITNVNLELKPEDITNGYNNEENRYYLAWDDSLLKPYGATMGQIFGIELNKYLGDINTGGVFNTSAGGSFDAIDKTRTFYNNIPFAFFGQEVKIPIDSTLETEYYDVNNSINERSFFNNFVRSLYNIIYERAVAQKDPQNPLDVNNREYVDIDGDTTPNYRRMISYTTPTQAYRSFNRYTSVDSNSDFIKLIGKIHKDLSYIIKINMIDSYGNIEEEYDVNGKYVRGGYSLGSEIVKISLGELNYEYK